MKKLIVLSAPCGVGKSTISEELSKRQLLPDYVCIDSDEVGVNWWDYAGTENEDKFTDICLQRATEMSKEKNLLFASCLNPYDYYWKVSVPEKITETFFIGMTCSDDEIRRRLKARPEERMCGSEEFIDSQMEYSKWYKKNKGKFQFYIDNTDISIEQTVTMVTEFISKL